MPPQGWRGAFQTFGLSWDSTVPKVTREVCLFCPREANSGEHIFAAWLAELFEPRTKASKFSTYSAVFVPHRAGPVIRSETKRPHKGQAHQTRHFVVCKRCNNEWMSRLESRTKPVLKPLLKGKSKNLGKRELKILARWIALKTLVNEQAHEGQHSIPESDHEIIRGNKRLPDHWYIWIGHSDGWREPGNSYHSAKITRSKGPDGEELGLYPSVTLWLIGYFVAFVLILPGGRSALDFSNLGDVLQLVFPPGPTPVWPPQKRLDHETLAVLAQALAIGFDGVGIPMARVF